MDKSSVLELSAGLADRGLGDAIDSCDVFCTIDINSSNALPSCGVFGIGD
jgi:hypothetical protein